MPTLEITSLTKTVAGVSVLRDLDLSVENDDLFVLVGPSGCGKSTLLRLIAGLEVPDRGRILLNGRDVSKSPPRERDVAMVFQDYALYPHMRVRDNLAFGLRNAGLERGDIERRVTDVAGLLDMERLLDKRPSQLSGGQQQRVALGRAIVKAPAIFLLDEPLSSLDPALRLKTRRELVRLRRTLNTPMIMVTHDHAEALAMASRVMLMNEQGVQQIGAPRELLARPANLFVASFLAAPAMNLLPATCFNGISGMAIEPGATVGLRAGAIQLDLNANASQAVVEGVEILGERALIHLNYQGVTFMAEHALDDLPRAGQFADPTFNLSRAHIFDATGKAIHHPARPEDVAYAAE